MRKQKGNLPKSMWVFTPLPWRLKDAELWVALLLRDHPMSGHELLAACEKEGLKLDLKRTAQLLATLKKHGIVAEESGRYLCRHPALQRVDCRLGERQMLELIGLTQFDVNGRIFYSTVPPMSVSSTSAPGSCG